MLFMNTIKLLIIFILFFNTSCAFFVDGRQEVTLKAYPEDTKIFLDGEMVGIGEAKVKLDPINSSYQIAFANDNGYTNYTNKITRERTAPFKYTNKKTKIACIADGIIAYGTLLLFLPATFSIYQPKCNYTFKDRYFKVLDKGNNTNIIHQQDKF